MERDRGGDRGDPRLQTQVSFFQIKEVEVMKDRRQHIKPLMKQKKKEEEREMKYLLKIDGYMDIKIRDGLGIKIEID